MPQVKQLKLDEQHAEAIIELGIKYGAYSEEMPDTKKEKISAAEEIIAFTIDAWVNDEVTPDDEDPEVAESGRQIQEIFDIAGIDIDDDGEVTYGKLPELEEEDEDEDSDDDEEEDEDESPFDPDDYIDGYTDLSVSSKVKAIKALDTDDEDDMATLEALAEWEGEQDKPSSRVMNLIEEMIGEAEGDEEDEPEEDEDADADEDEDVEGSADEEPWEGYDGLSAVQIKKILNDQMEDEENPLTADQVQYVLDYEKNREKPPPRKRVVSLCEELLSELSDTDSGDDEDEDEDEEPEEKPAAKKRGRGRAKPASKPAKGDSNGDITLTREQILQALTEGEVTISL